MARHRGVTLVEVIIAAAVLVIMMSVLLQLMGVLSQQRRAMERRSWSIQADCNLMERFTAQDWDEITADTADQLELPTEMIDLFPDVELHVHVEEDRLGPPAKCVIVVISGQDLSGEQTSLARLSVWVYRHQEKST